MWVAWVQHRRELRKPLTASTAARQLAMLAKLPPDQACACVEASITNGWQGLFPEKVAGKQQYHPATAPAGTYANVAQRFDEEDT